MLEDQPSADHEKLPPGLVTALRQSESYFASGGKGISSEEILRRVRARSAM